MCTYQYIYTCKYMHTYIQVRIHVVNTLDPVSVTLNENRSFHVGLSVFLRIFVFCVCPSAVMTQYGSDLPNRSIYVCVCVCVCVCVRVRVCEGIFVFCVCPSAIMTQYGSVLPIQPIFLCACVKVCECMHVCVCLRIFVFCVCILAVIMHYGLATISRLLQIIGLFCKRAL